METQEKISPLEKAGQTALRQASQGPVKFDMLEKLARDNGIPFQRLLSFLDLASSGSCAIDHQSRTVDCRQGR